MPIATAAAAVVACFGAKMPPTHRHVPPQPRATATGKRVRIVPEYKRTFGGGDQDGDAPARAAVERTFASVFYNNERNAARTLIAEGLATVARHGQADERSTMYDAQFWRNSAQFGAIL